LREKARQTGSSRRDFEIIESVTAAAAAAIIHRWDQIHCHFLSIMLQSANIIIATTRVV
jgi:hypothetical protein